MRIFTRPKKAWERAKLAAHNAKVYKVGAPLAGWANGDQMVYALNGAYLEIGQGGNSPIRGWFALPFGFLLVFSFLLGPSFFLNVMEMVERQGVEALGWDTIADVILGLAVIGLGLMVCGTYLFNTFFSVTDATIRFDHKRKKVWMWTGKGPIEMDWANLVPRVESNVATAYATVSTCRGQYAEVDAAGLIKATGRILHLFQVGQISAAAEGVLPSMEYVRRYMESGPSSVNPPETFLSHRVRWYAVVNFMGMADDWIRWKAHREHPGVAPAPIGKTLTYVLLFPLTVPVQFTNWLALAVAPKPKWPREIEAMHQADLARCQAEEAERRRADPLLDRAREADKPRRQPVIRVNGELVSGRPADE